MTDRNYYKSVAIAFEKALHRNCSTNWHCTTTAARMGTAPQLRLGIAFSPSLPDRSCHNRAAYAHTHTRIHVCAYAHACKHGLVRTRASQASSHGTIDAGNFSLCIAPVPSQCVSDKCIGTSNSLYMLRVEWTPLGGSHSKMTKGSWRWAELCSLPLFRLQSAE